MKLDVVAMVTGRLQSCAVIGAYALAARGYVRMTRDFDLLTTDTKALEPKTWEGLRRHGLDVDVRKGDADDPLAGVVRIKSPDSSIDLVVGKSKWQQEVIDRAETMQVGSTSIKVPRTADLILLKLFAGGYGDLYDISRLLMIGPREQIIAEVERALDPLPDEMKRRWRALLAEL